MNDEQPNGCGWLGMVLAVLIIIGGLLLWPREAGGQGYPPPPPTYLPPPPPLYRPTPTTTPGPVCCYVYAPAMWSGNITYGIEPGRMTP